MKNQLMTASTYSFIDSKKHLLILDALRGLAAILVVTMHTFEFYSGDDYHKLFISHGYLAVDFFFMLSGYVMAYAYDDRWHKMTIIDFCKRRLIRLHPLIILGMSLGALFYYFHVSAILPNVTDTSSWKLFAIMVFGYALIPIRQSMDITGRNEMYPLNGAAWSLFFEYVANILHVFILRKLSNRILSIFVFLAGLSLFYVATSSQSGDLTGGWSLDLHNLKIGFTRLLFPYMAGMLLARVANVGSSKRTFLLTSVLLVLVLSFPRVGGYENVWVNGLFDSSTVVILFPLIIYLGALGEVKGAFTQKVCTFLGNISYPLYITHFPLICIYNAWVKNHNIPIAQGVPVGILLVILTIVMAYTFLKLYDVPIRKWLAIQFIYSKKVLPNPMIVVPKTL